MEITIVTKPLAPQLLEEEQLGMKQELEEVHTSATTAEEELAETQVGREKLDHLRLGGLAFKGWVNAPFHPPK